MTTGVPELDKLLGGGYPDRSAVLLSGPSGVGKEALRYWFMEEGLKDGDYCLYISKSTPAEILQDFRAFGVRPDRSPDWFCRKGGDKDLNLNDLASISFNIKGMMQANEGRKIRIATDVLSSLLVLNSVETVYRFLSQLFADVKDHDAALVATLEEGMHDERAVSTMKELFDGVIEFKLYERGFRVSPLLRVQKMRGMAPSPGYFSFSMPKGKMEISPFVR
jgi:KaiC/GvpD/RAD55 family RecA-like ATPase